MSIATLVERIKRILLEPRDEWPKIAAETASVPSLYTSWIMILAAVGPLALLLSMHSLQSAIALYIRSLIMTFVLALVVDTLAPSFGGVKDFVASLKLTAYSSTVTWLAGVFYLFGVMGSLLSLVAAIYALYTFFLGAPVLNKAAPDRAAPFTLIVVLCAVVLFFLARFAFTGVGTTPPFHAGMGLTLR